MNLVEQVTEQVRKEIEQGILQAKADGRFDFTEMPAFIVEVPKDKSHGDFATNAAMLLTKQAKMKPRDIAQAIVDSLNKESKLIEKVEIAGPGFINFQMRDRSGTVRKAYRLPEHRSSPFLPGNGRQHRLPSSFPQRPGH